ncbi:ABC transporter ATP-binding protein [Angustibacter aerolatus]|uniref:ABC transporter ATP-binding protein n=1 Tax=Angustibacter aerolatus TaxID=1162965 RepID=A0ABQ6J9Z4_9ACTN|nr:ABC transporter ATP-binding protein [Angustibacter aerolatus]GMA84983.1 ABC transporter ATP-binding protein [Angustibacter aerolatus]
MATLDIRGLHVTVDTEQGTKEILRGVDLTVRAGETHAIMGPNGSGKSTLAYSIAGHPKYTVTGGTVTLDGEDVLAMTVDERARAGLFLAMQYPVEVPGVSVANFLRTAKTAIDGEAPKPAHLDQGRARCHGAACAWTRPSPSATSTRASAAARRSATRSSRWSLLKPKVAVLDETDSGLDVDALKIVSEGVNRVREGGEVGVLLITHYTRILRYISPDFVHVFVDGRIAEQGGPEPGHPARGRGLRPVPADRRDAGEQGLT